MTRSPLHPLALVLLAPVALALFFLAGLACLVLAIDWVEAGQGPPWEEEG